MTQSAEPAAISSAAANKGVKRGLPSAGLPDAARSANALWEVARLGLAPNRAFAEKLGRRSASGGGWATLVALLRGFGLIRVEGDQIGLSSLGQELVNGSNPIQQLAARRTAVLQLKAYRELVESFDGTEVPDKATLASRLKFEYGKTDDFADKAAQAFLDSLDFAEMVDAQGRLHKSGADAAVEPSPEPDEDDEQAELIDDAFDVEYDAEDDEESAPDARVADVAERLNGPAQVNISVTLDLSKYRSDEVIEILKALNG